MQDLEILTPADGSRIVRDDSSVILFGQPPEVLKGLIIQNITSFETLVLTDIREKDGSLLNNLEFPIYFFLFVAHGLSEGRKINLVGEADHISQVLRLLRYTLIGPTREELQDWKTDPGLQSEWLAACEALALLDRKGKAIPVEGFFNPMPFVDGRVEIDDFTIEHTGRDHYKVSNDSGHITVDLNEDTSIKPPYLVQHDYVPGGLIKMGLEILGGASGFTPNEPCTGLALCYNGDYVLIDSIPFLDQHLFARGISKNQITAVYLTHLHDDHCAMFPLMLMPHRVEVMTTREIFSMAIEKLASNLGWKPSVVEEFFELVEVHPGQRHNFYGLVIEPHVTVHSIPTIGATFSTIHQGYERQICIVGDNHSMTTIRNLGSKGLIRPETIENLERLYTQRFTLLVADGGAGEIHGDPTGALHAESGGVVFVHIDNLPAELNATFSLASSGKRYTVIEGDSGIYMSQINHYLTLWLGEPFPNKWMRSLLAEEEIRRYNTDDVIIAQDSATRGYVFLLLTGYCEVVYHDGKSFSSVALLQAGDVIGEMAVISGRGKRNASVIARSPVTVCVFAEETFRAFIETQGFKQKLLRRWSLRPTVKELPQFSSLLSIVIERICNIAEWEKLEGGERRELNLDYWYIFADGDAATETTDLFSGDEFGWRPFSTPREESITSKAGCRLVRIPTRPALDLMRDTPQLNYFLRKLRVEQDDPTVDWILGEVDTYQPIS
jgi:CRP-like cAMP-binding protein